MVERDHAELSIRRQCDLLSLHRSGLYESRDKKPPEEDAELMKEIDKIYTDRPYFGSRRIRNILRRQGWKINRKRVQRLMRAMGIEGVAPGPRTSRPHPEHQVYPYLLRNLNVVRPNQVWCADITYIPMKKGHMYLVAVMDWFSRRVLSWELSNSLDSSFCVDALQQALASYGTPEIFNTDQGCQFTSEAFVSVLQDAGIRISMDGRGRALDNIFIERLWRSVKYEDIYLNDYENVPDLYRGLIRYFRRYNDDRPHQGLNDQTPSEVYFGTQVSPAPMGAPPAGEQQQQQEQHKQPCQATP